MITSLIKMLEHGTIIVRIIVPWLELRNFGHMITFTT